MNGEPPVTADVHRQGGGILDSQVVELAPLLLGAVLENRDAEGTVAVRLTEVEAYTGSLDPGSHAFRGPTARNASMFGPSGRLYVYFTYGMHWCVNVVCAPAGEPAAILLRAGAVVHGVDLARRRRPAARTGRDLARGPARLAAALGLNGADDGEPVLVGPLSDGKAAGPPSSGEVAGPFPTGRGPAGPGPPSGPGEGSGRDRGVRLRLPGGPPDPRVRRGPRVGIRGPGGDGVRFPWRFWLEGESTVSAYRPAAPRPGRAARPRGSEGESLAPGRERRERPFPPGNRVGPLRRGPQYRAEARREPEP